MSTNADSRTDAAAAGPGGEKYDLEALMKIVKEERAFDESVKVRVTQEDIRKLIEKKRKRPR